MSERGKQVEQLVSLSIIALLIIGSIVLVLPFLSAIRWAMVFAVTIWPYFVKLEKFLGGRTSLPAAVPTLLLALIFFAPLVYVSYKLWLTDLALPFMSPRTFDYVALRHVWRTSPHLRLIREEPTLAAQISELARSATTNPAIRTGKNAK